MNDKQFIDRAQNAQTSIRLAELLHLADAEVKKWQDACIEVQAERDALEADLARCRAANVYDAEAHKRVADLEAALRYWSGYDDIDFAIKQAAARGELTKPTAPETACGKEPK